MGNLNAEQISRTFNACIAGECVRGKCPLYNHEEPVQECISKLAKNALALITSQEQRIKELTEENERLKGERKLCYKCGKYYLSAWSRCPYCLTKPDIANDVKSDTVRKMQERLKEYFGTYVLGYKIPLTDALKAVNQIAKEVLGE